MSYPSYWQRPLLGSKLPVTQLQLFPLGPLTQDDLQGELHQCNFIVAAFMCIIESPSIQSTPYSAAYRCPEPETSRARIGVSVTSQDLCSSQTSCLQVLKCLNICVDSCRC
eukprot:jgi/Ulvmu1/6435/UM003_0064.1